MERKFKITEVTVHAFSTRFSIKDLDHKNKENLMSPEAFFIISEDSPGKAWIK